MVPERLLEPAQEPLEAPRREFTEEAAPRTPAAPLALKPLRQARGKAVLCWAAEANLDLSAFSPGKFELEWPPRPGNRATFPEMDRVGHFETAVALAQIPPSQAPLIAEALFLLGEET
jgi:predicted NUDIX family NTP pyrophosphohydrolase